ncbi:MAG: hypothetical protein ACOCUU_01575 [Nanoarchaeota archaeon]
MAKVKIDCLLFNNIKKKFKGEAHKIIDLLETLEDHPKKEKIIGNAGNVAIREIKYKKFRFYFIINGFKIKVVDKFHLLVSGNPKYKNKTKCLP